SVTCFRRGGRRYIGNFDFRSRLALPTWPAREMNGCPRMGRTHRLFHVSAHQEIGAELFRNRFARICGWDLNDARLFSCLARVKLAHWIRGARDRRGTTLRLNGTGLFPEHPREIRANRLLLAACAFFLLWRRRGMRRWRRDGSNVGHLLSSPG